MENCPTKSTRKRHRKNGQRKRSPQCKIQRLDSTKIIDLNDDCLVKIFSHLGLANLFSIAIASEWLRPAARDVYKRKFGSKVVFIQRCGDFHPNTRAKAYKTLPFSRLIAPKESNDEITITGLRTTLQYLRCFGPSITDISIHYNQSSSKRYQYVHLYINEYCAESLTEFAFRDKLNISIEHFAKPFVNIEKVYVRDSDLGEQLPLFVEWFPHLCDLHFDEITLDRRFINAPFQHLKTFDYTCSRRVGLTANDLGVLLALNHQIQVLRIEYGCPLDLTMGSLLDMIKNNPMICKLDVLLLNLARHYDVKQSEMQRLVCEHPALVKFNTEFLPFTAENIILMIEQLTSLKKLDIQLQNSAEYIKLKSKLNNEWQIVHEYYRKVTGEQLVVLKRRRNMQFC